MAKNFKIAEINTESIYNVQTIDKWDGSTDTREMTGTELISFTQAFSHLYDIHAKKVEDNQERAASVFCDAIRTIASKPENLENLEYYLSRHFVEWLKRYANTPEDISSEMREFAEMII